MLVLSPRRAEAERLRDRRGLVSEFGRAGDEAYGADHSAEPLDGTHHLEGKLRHAVPEVLQREPLEHHIGEAAIGRRVLGAFLCDDQRVRRLILGAAMHPHGHCGEVELAPVHPDPPHEADRAFAEPDREIGEIAVGSADRLRPAPTALAAARTGALDRGVRDLLEARRPDQLAADAGASIDPRDRRALGRGEPVELLQPRPLDEARAVRAGEQRLVDERSRDGAEHAPDRASDRAAGCRPESGTDGGEEEGSHEQFSRNGARPYACGRGRATPKAASA